MTARELGAPGSHLLPPAITSAIVQGSHKFLVDLSVNRRTLNLNGLGQQLPLTLFPSVQGHHSVIYLPGSQFQLTLLVADQFPCDY